MTTRAPNVHDNRRQRRALDADLREAQQVADAAEYLLSTLIAQAHITAHQVMASGLPGGGVDGERVGGGETVSRPVEAAAAQRSRLSWALEQLHKDLAAARVATIKAHRSATILAGLAVPDDPEALAPGSGECQACGRWVPGLPNDRIKAGYCEADYRAWRRDGGDRKAFERKRQQDVSPDA